jgi:hypothetical protein
MKYRANKMPPTIAKIAEPGNSKKSPIPARVHFEGSTPSQRNPERMAQNATTSTLTAP